MIVHRGRGTSILAHPIVLKVRNESSIEVLNSCRRRQTGLCNLGYLVTNWCHIISLRKCGRVDIELLQGNKRCVDLCTYCGF